MSILELKHITKTFGGVHAVDSASLGFEQGKVTALIGPNGAGKTTVFNCISGFLTPDTGTVTYRGDDVTGLNAWQIAQRGIGRLFQDVRLFYKMTVLDNVMAAFPDQQGERVWRSVFIRWKVNGQERVLTDRAVELLEFVGLSDKADSLGEDLSFGQQKLVALARLLAADADVLLLDEPVAGVNPGLAETLLATIRRLAVQGKTVVVIEHNMNAVLDVADWAYFMDDGALTSSGLPQDVLADPKVRAAYMGLDESSDGTQETNESAPAA